MTRSTRCGSRFRWRTALGSRVPSPADRACGSCLHTSLRSGVCMCMYKNLSMVCVCVCLYFPFDRTVEGSHCDRRRPALLDNMLSSHHSSAEVEAFPHIITPLSNTHMQLLLSSSSCEVPGARASIQSSSHLYYMTSLHILILVHFREMNISSTPVVRALGML